MYALRRWDEERIIQGLAVLMCIAMVGMMVMPALSQSYLFGEYMLHKNMRKGVSPIGEGIAAVAVMDGLYWTCLLISVASCGTAVPLFILGTGAVLW